MKRRTAVYICAPEDGTPPLKIGQSWCPRLRRDNHRIKSRRRNLEIIYEIWFDDRRVARAIEYFVKKSFSAPGYNGEWFDVSVGTMKANIAQGIRFVEKFGTEIYKTSKSGVKVRGHLERAGQ